MRAPQAPQKRKPAWTGWPQDVQGVDSPPPAGGVSAGGGNAAGGGAAACGSASAALRAVSHAHSRSAPIGAGAGTTEAGAGAGWAGPPRTTCWDDVPPLLPGVPSGATGIPAAGVGVRGPGGGAGAGAGIADGACRIAAWAAGSNGDGVARETTCSLVSSPPQVRQKR
jgi:hypothetical protein